MDHDILAKWKSLCLPLLALDPPDGRVDWALENCVAVGRGRRLCSRDFGGTSVDCWVMASEAGLRDIRSGAVASSSWRFHFS